MCVSVCVYVCVCVNMPVSAFIICVHVIIWGCISIQSTILYNMEGLGLYRLYWILDYT